MRNMASFVGLQVIVPMVYHIMEKKGNMKIWFYLRNTFKQPIP